MSEHSSASAKSSPLKGYFAVWIALLIGTGLTVYAATLDLAPYNAAVALGIATIKATWSYSSSCTSGMPAKS